MPPGDKRLPLRVIKLASDMFARGTGFSGPQIHEFFAEYSDAIGPYQWGGAPSRWQIFEDALALLSFEEQVTVLLDLLDYDGPMNHGEPSPEEKQKLREALAGSPVPAVERTGASLQAMDWTHVHKEWQRILANLERDPESAITSTRALLEGVCKHILDERHEAYDDAWDLSRLYKAAARQLNLSPDQHTEQVFKQVLSGCSNVVAGMASLRNTYGSAHGKSQRYVRPSPRHAHLVVNLGGAMAAFLVETFAEQQP